MRYILLCALLAGSMNLWAAEDDSIKGRDNTDPLYFQLYAGINKSANENLPWTEFSGYPWSIGVFAGMGKEWSPVMGWRAAFRYNHNKSRNVRECESPDTWGWDNLALFGDVTLDLTDLFFTKTKTKAKTKTKRLATKTGRFANNSGRGSVSGDKSLEYDEGYTRWNVKAFAGVGAAYTFGYSNKPLSYLHPYNRNSRVLPAFRVGATATYRLSANLRIGMELSQSLFRDNFNGVTADTPLDGRTNLKIGMTYLFVNEKKKPKANMPVVYDHRLRMIPDLPFVLPDVESVKRRKIAGRAFIDFPVNETVIYPRYRRNPQELKRIVTTVDSALFDKSIQVTNISLHGYASPESAYSNNTRLSKGRVAALRDYLQKRFGFSASQFTLENTPEDWDNLRGFIENSDRQRVKGDIWYENKNILETPEAPEIITRNKAELLRVINLDIDEDEKEQKLKQVAGGEPYKWLLKYVYPGLRHTDYTIEYIVRQYPVEEGRRLIYTHPEALSINEMYQVANSYVEGSDGWLDAMQIAAKQYPDDETANLNAACACVKVRRLADAKRYLAKAGDTEQTRYLLDVIAAMEGSLEWKLVNGKVVFPYQR